MRDWPEVDQAALRRHRMERTAELMAGVDVDHLLLTGFDDLRFVTDFRSLIIAEGFDWFAAIVDRDGGFELFVPWIDEEHAEPDPDLPNLRVTHPMPSWAPASTHLGYWVATLARRLRAAGARRLGFELVLGDLLDALRSELTQVEFVPVATELHDLRMEKHPIELELLAAASAANSRAADAAMEAAAAGMRDYDVLAVAMQHLQSQGVEYLSHSVCNVRRGTGTWFAVGNELREGEAFFFDIGCYGRGGYASDMARTAFVGEPPEPVREAYKHLLEAHRVGEETARPGVRASEVHEAVNAYLRGCGLPITPYSVGHGIGLRACEVPTIHRADRIARDQVLRENMAIALEPETGVEVDGRFVLMKVEDDYVVEAGGLRRLTDASYGPFAD